MMNGKKLRSILAITIILALFFALAACGGGTQQQAPATQQPPAAQQQQPAGQPAENNQPAPAPAQDPITWDFVCSWVKGNFNYDRLELFKEIVEKETDGRLIINIVGGPEVFEATETAEACINGVIDGAYTSCGYAAGYIPIGEVVSVSDMTNPEMKASGAVDFLREAYEKSGLYYYAAVNEVEYTRFHIYVNDPISSLDDLNGRRLRASLGIWSDVASGLGIVPSPIAFTEVYTALEQGLVEGYIAPAFSGVNEGFFEFSKHMILPGMGRPGTIMVFNLDSWNALPDDLKQILLDKCDYITEQWDEVVDKQAMGKNIAALEEKGGSVINLSAADSEKLATVFNDISWSIIEKNCPEYNIDDLKKLFLK